MADGRKYKDEDVRAVIDRALSRQSDAAVSHSDLVAIGAEVGLSAHEIESAAQDVAEARLDDEAARLVTKRRRRALAAHAFVFAGLNGFLFSINYLSTPGEWWVLFPVFAWGLALLAHAALALGLKVSEKSLDRERARMAQRSSKSRPRRRVAALDDDVALEAPDAATDAALESGSEAISSRRAR